MSIVLLRDTEGQVTGGYSIGGGGGGSGTITSLTAGTGITLTPNPIVTTGIISLGATPQFTGYDVIVFAGQSNMSGGHLGDPNLDLYADYTERSYMWDTGNIGYAPTYALLAGDPMITSNGFTSTAVGGVQSGQPFIGPAMSFIREYVKTMLASRKVMAVQTAVGGQALVGSVWAVGGSLYNNCVACANAAMAFGPVPSGNNLIAIFWVQGEQDGFNGSTAVQYNTALTAMIAGMRSSITRASTAPFVIGSMVMATSPAVQILGQGLSIYTTPQINAAQGNFPLFHANSSYTIGTNTSGLTNDIHYSTKDQRSTIGPGLFTTGLVNAIANISPPYNSYANAGGITDIITLSATSGVTTGVVTLTWTANTTGTATTITYTILNLTSVTISGTTTLLTFAVTGLTNGTPYTFSILPINAITNGPQSNQITSTPSNPGGGQPGAFTSSITTQTLSLLSTPSPAATSYTLLINGTTISGILAGAFPYTITNANFGLSPTTSYAALLSAVNGSGSTASSSNGGGGMTFTSASGGGGSISWAVSGVTAPIMWLRMKGDGANGSFPVDGTGGVINDYSGNSNNGTVTGSGFQFGADAIAVRGVIMNYPATIPGGVETTTPWPVASSWSGWVLWTSGPNPSYFAGDYFATALQLFWNTGSPGTIRAATQVSGSAYMTLNQPFSINTWYHLVVTYGAAGSTNIYVNGTLVVGSPVVDPDFATYATGPRANITFCDIGGGFDLQVFGQITDYCVFNYPLTGTQVTSIYNAQLIPGDTHS